MKKSSWLSPERFSPQRYERELEVVIDALCAEPQLDAEALRRIVTRHPKPDGGFFSKSELVWAARRAASRSADPAELEGLIPRLRAKPIRTQSGVTPVTVLTRPHPCPGRCVFCPNDPRAPKSYLAGEPGAQRAARFGYDAYAQVTGRLRALALMGHPVDKIELIILGGTWTAYPEAYRLAFVSGCFRALNEFRPDSADTLDLTPLVDRTEPSIGPYGKRLGTREYNRLVEPGPEGMAERAAPTVTQWHRLAALHQANESALCRCVGMSVETRPDQVTMEAALALRRLGVTRVQIGCQSLSDRILELNHRDHSVEDSRQAIALLRRFGFKVQVHWMANLLGTTPEADVEDFARLFDDIGVRPDEIKIYPCMVVPNSELADAYERGDHVPYSTETLVDVLARCLRMVPPYCRVNRLMRDIPGTDVVGGSRHNSLRGQVEARIEALGSVCRDIRSREIRTRTQQLSPPRMEILEVPTAASREYFIEFVSDGLLCAFARLGLPHLPAPLPELSGAALLREVHVYGQAAALGARPAVAVQHRGLGARLVDQATQLASQAGYRSLAVISSVGTRGYYRRLGFADGALYQHRRL